jgi:hypothetical protein
MEMQRISGHLLLGVLHFKKYLLPQLNDRTDSISNVFEFELESDLN